MAKNEIKIVFNHIPSLDSKSRRKTEQLVEFAARQYKSEARRQSPFKTGFLRSNILAHKRGSMTWDIIAHAYYSIFQEFGTSRGVAPHPFMGPAADMIRPKFLRALGRIFK